MFSVFVINVNVLLLAAIVLLAFIVGYSLKTGKLKKLRKRVYELEQEMLSNHARILELEQKNAILEMRSEKQKEVNA